MNTLGNILDALEVCFGIYSIAYMAMFCALGIFSYIEIKKYYNSKIYLHNDVIIKSNNTIGVSVIAPAYNEGQTIIYNVKSLLSQEYPKYEIIVVNDGSTDDSLEKLIKEFSLIKVDFFYNEKIKTHTVRGHYKSTNPVYKKLLIVDKENNKSKADALNAGINSARYSKIICTDVDCILRKDTIAILVKPYIEQTTKTIATGAAITTTTGSGFTINGITVGDIAATLSTTTASDAADVAVTAINAISDKSGVTASQTGGVITLSSKNGGDIKLKTG